MKKITIIFSAIFIFGTLFGSHGFVYGVTAAEQAQIDAEQRKKDKAALDKIAADAKAAAAKAKANPKKGAAALIKKAKILENNKKKFNKKFNKKPLTKKEKQKLRVGGLESQTTRDVTRNGYKGPYGGGTKQTAAQTLISNIKNTSTQAISSVKASVKASFKSVFLANLKKKEEEKKRREEEKKEKIKKAKAKVIAGLQTKMNKVVSLGQTAKARNSKAYKTARDEYLKAKLNARVKGVAISNAQQAQMAVSASGGVSNGDAGQGRNTGTLTASDRAIGASTPSSVTDSSVPSSSPPLPTRPTQSIKQALLDKEAEEKKKKEDEKDKIVRALGIWGVLPGIGESTTKYGVNVDKAMQELGKMAKATGVPVVDTLAKGSIELPSTNPLYGCNSKGACGAFQVKESTAKSAWNYHVGKKTAAGKIFKDKYGSKNDFIKTFVGKKGAHDAYVAQALVSNAYDRVIKDIVPSADTPGKVAALYNAGPGRGMPKNKGRWDSLIGYLSGGKSQSSIKVRETRNYVVLFEKNRAIIQNGRSASKLARAGRYPATWDKIISAYTAYTSSTVPAPAVAGFKKTVVQQEKELAAKKKLEEEKKKKETREKVLAALQKLGIKTNSTAPTKATIGATATKRSPSVPAPSRLTTKQAGERNLTRLTQDIVRAQVAQKATEVRIAKKKEEIRLQIAAAEKKVQTEQAIRGRIILAKRSAERAASAKLFADAIQAGADTQRAQIDRERKVFAESLARQKLIQVEIATLRAEQQRAAESEPQFTAEETRKALESVGPFGTSADGEVARFTGGNQFSGLGGGTATPSSPTPSSAPLWQQRFSQFFGFGASTSESTLKRQQLAAQEKELEKERNKKEALKKAAVQAMTADFLSSPVELSEFNSTPRPLTVKQFAAAEREERRAEARRRELAAREVATQRVLGLERARDVAQRDQLTFLEKLEQLNESTRKVQAAAQKVERREATARISAYRPPAQDYAIPPLSKGGDSTTNTIDKLLGSNGAHDRSVKKEIARGGFGQQVAGGGARPTVQDAFSNLRAREDAGKATDEDRQAAYRAAVRANNAYNEAVKAGIDKKTQKELQNLGNSAAGGYIGPDNPSTPPSGGSVAFPSFGSASVSSPQVQPVPQLQPQPVIQEPFQQLASLQQESQLPQYSEFSSSSNERPDAYLNSRYGDAILDDAKMRIEYDGQGVGWATSGTRSCELIGSGAPRKTGGYVQTGPLQTGTRLELECSTDNGSVFKYMTI